MPRGRKLTTQQIQEAAQDRRNGMTWRELSRKYNCAVNTIRFSLLDYSDEFHPKDPPQRCELVNQIQQLQSEWDSLKRVLKKRFNLHI